MGNQGSWHDLYEYFPVEFYGLGHLFWAIWNKELTQFCKSMFQKGGLSKVGSVVVIDKKQDEVHSFKENRKQESI